MTIKKMMISVALVFLALLGVLITGGLSMLLLCDRRANGPTKKIRFSIPRGMIFDQVASLMKERGLIANQFNFEICAFLHGGRARVKAGDYTLTTPLAPNELLAALIKGSKRRAVTATIVEGQHIDEVADLLASLGVSIRGQLRSAMRDSAFLRRMKIEGPSVEGYLFPDTYRFFLDSDPYLVLEKMISRHREVVRRLINETPGNWRRLSSQLGWKKRELVILASIVEKETGVSNEMALIAGVFLNRLLLPSFRSRLLQADPTIRYGCAVAKQRTEACFRFNRRIRRVHLVDRANRYNTYVFRDLPPGPISNPGEDALRAVLSPDRRRGYLFFVAKNDGTHSFSTTLRDHRKAVERYQLNRSSGRSGHSKTGSPPEKR